MTDIVNSFLNKVTTYRLMLYYLLSLLAVAILLSATRVLPSSFVDIIVTTSVLLLTCQVTNKLFAGIFKATTNRESALITALILSLIVSPSGFSRNIFFLIVIGTIAMASKYLIAIKKRHIFNPAAFAVFISALFFGQGASWWVGNIFMLPFVFIGGLLIIIKLKKFKMVASFLLVYMLLLSITSISKNISVSYTLLNILNHSPILFFSFVMLIEPLTSPLNKKIQVYFAVLTAFVWVLYQLLFFNVSYTLELALLTGNLYFFLVNPSFKIFLKFIKKRKVAAGTFEFSFDPMTKFRFAPGQYLEWTLNHPRPDSRGNRRYFTISSSPTEKLVTLTTKIAKKSSSFKKALLKIKKGDEIAATGPAGEFTLPIISKQPVAFIAGGIGITPFRSMIQYLLDTRQKRNIVLIYVNKTSKEIVFKDIFDRAKEEIGLKVIYILTSETGHLKEKTIKKEISDIKKRLFYISGPEKMVKTASKILEKMGVNQKDIKKDFFPGY